MHPRSGIIVALTLVALATAGCGSSPTSPGIQPEIVNAPNSFEYQVSAIRNYSGTTAYTWQNTGTAAKLNLSTVADAGEATLTVLDANDVEVFSGALDANGDFSTTTGAAGDWTLRVEYASFSGTVNFRAESV